MPERETNAMDTAEVKRMAGIWVENARVLRNNMEATSDAARRGSTMLGVMAGTHTAYSDDDFAARMEEAEAIGHRAGFDDAMSQVVELIIDVAGRDDSSLIDPDKLIGYLGDLKPLVKGQDDGA